MKFTVSLEGSVPRLGAALQAIAVCGAMLYVQLTASSALITHVAMLGVGLAYGRLLAVPDAPQRI